MLYWTATISAHALGGVSDFALRLPTALAAVALVLLTYAAGSRWYDTRTGLWAGFMLLTFLQFAYNAVNYRPDVQFALWIGAGMFAYAHGAGERPNWLWRVSGFAMLGLAMLTKGPLGLLLPGLVLTLWLGSRREWRRLFELAPLSLVALGVYLPWFVACARAMGADSILYELYAQNFQRFLSGSRGHEQPLYYYLRWIWFNLAPWSPLLPIAIWWAVRSRLASERNVQLALWWFGTFFVFLSLAVTKRELYLLPAYPAAALLLAPWVARHAAGEGSPRPVRVFGAALALLFVVAGLAAFGAVMAYEPIVARADLDDVGRETAPALRAPLLAVGAVLLLAGLWIGHAWWARDARAVLIRTGLSQIPLYLVLLAWALPAMNPLRTYKPQSAWIRAQIGSETHIGMVNPWNGLKKRGAFGYYTVALVDLLDSAEEVERFFGEHPSSLVLVHQRSREETFTGKEPEWAKRIVRELETAGDRYVVVRGPQLGGPTPLADR